MHDLIILNARIVEGSGAPAFDGSVVIDGATITQSLWGAGGPAQVGRPMRVGSSTQAATCSHRGSLTSTRIKTARCAGTSRSHPVAGMA